MQTSRNSLKLHKATGQCDLNLNNLLTYRMWFFKPKNAKKTKRKVVKCSANKRRNKNYYY